MSFNPSSWFEFIAYKDYLNLPVINSTFTSFPADLKPAIKKLSRISQNNRNGSPVTLGNYRLISSNKSNSSLDFLVPKTSFSPSFEDVPYLYETFSLDL